MCPAKGTRKPQAKGEDFTRTKPYQTMVRSSREDKAVFHALAEYWGVSVSDALILLARKEMRKEGVKVRDLDLYR